MQPLLCELHAHTTWSDGTLSVRELVDLYGAAGFDVLAVTDHVVRAGEDPPQVTAADYGRYLAEIEWEAERAAGRYGMLVIPGLELTYNDEDPLHSAHAVAVGLRQFVGVDDGLDVACAAARAAGAALIAAHPYAAGDTGARARATAGWAADPERARSLVDRFELVNRHETFDWVAAAKLPVVANGDFHRPEHLETWKTVLHAEPTREAVLEALRAPGRVDLTRFERSRLAA